MQAIPVYSGVSYEEQWPTILELIRKYEPTTDYFLIDTKDPQSTIGIGATGATHDRTIDRAIVEATKIPCIIAGGLDPDNVAEAIHTAHPYGVDTCTRTNLPKEQQDITNGLKDREKVKAFIEATKMRETRPVIVIGDACVDVTVRLADLMVGHSDVYDSERLLPTISGGGTSANTAVALSKLGVATAFMGTIGDDYGGRFMLREFAERGHRHGADHCG